MTLSEEARERLADVVKLQPTKNAELAERWDLESGSDVHQYLESELGDYYYRDDNSLIRATADAAELVGVEPGITDDGAGTVRVSELQEQVIDVLSGPEGRSMSVVSVLHALRDTHDVDPDVDDVRSALQRLKRTGIVEVTYRNVPTFRLSRPREELDFERSD